MQLCRNAPLLGWRLLVHKPHMRLDHGQPDPISNAAANSATNTAADITTDESPNYNRTHAAADPAASASTHQSTHQSTDHCIPDTGRNSTSNNATDQLTDPACYGQSGKLRADIVTNCKPCDRRTDPSTFTAADAGNDRITDHDRADDRC